MSKFRSLLIAVLLFTAVSAFAQQEYVPRFNAYTGFSYLATPKQNLYQRGFDSEMGVNVTRWLALGADFSVMTGTSSLVPHGLDPAVRAKLAAYTFPAGYQLFVPYDATTYTYTAGPQLNYRHFKKVTLFVRPAIGLLHESVTLKPKDPIQTAVVAQVTSSGKANDTVWFLGVGGGFDLNASKHVGLRVTTDWVHSFPFEGLLATSRNAVRVTVGPTFRFGKNVPK